MDIIQSCIKKYGADPAFLLDFREDSANLLPYASILNAKSKGDEDLSLVCAVYEWQNSPLLYIADDNCARDKNQLSNLRHKLAMRGDAPYLGVMSEKTFDIFQIALDRKPIYDSSINGSIGSFQSHSEIEQSLFSELGNNRPTVLKEQSTWISSVILKLLTNSISKLIKIGDVNRNDAISLVGRAIFARFLGDRDLIPKSLQSEGNSHELFDDKVNAEKTTNWLDKTFNGDFLPLTPNVYSRLTKDSFHELGNIMRKAVSGQLYLGWEQKWNKLDFAHIPVGVLSQAYEAYLKEHDPVLQRKQSAYYTPTQIVNVMVKAAIHALKGQKDIRKIKVLDPAAGAGVFLIAAFRELVAERWQIDKVRPDTKTLRSILDNQITGFEIDESAISFAALGLYLISIELDPEIGKNSKLDLKFNYLRERVLHNFSHKTDDKHSELGSLCPKILKKHAKKYDIVVGNPPWSSRFDENSKTRVRNCIQEILQKRMQTDDVPKLAIKSDIAFLWYSMEWVKPKGQIALVMHARWLFKQFKNMPETREAIFRALDIKSIVNCSKLLETKVWPNVRAPFCMLFAHNEHYGPQSAFRFINPNIEKSLNDSGNFRIDAIETEFVTVEQIIEYPPILKLLSNGTKLDHKLIEHLKSQDIQTLRELISNLDLEDRQSDRPISGVGFSRLGSSTNSDGKDSSDFIGKPEVVREDMEKTVISAASLRKFDDAKLRDIRKPEIYNGPLLLVHSSPSADNQRMVSSIVDSDVMYSETIYGYSMRNIKNSGKILKFLNLIVRSKIALWQILLSSGKFGIERQAFEKSELDKMIVPKFENLSKAQINRLDELFENTDSSKELPDEVDQWVAKLYGLENSDLEQIKDTLKFNLPFPDCYIESQSPPKKPEVRDFCAVLEAELNPIAMIKNTNVKITPLMSNSSSTWLILDVGFNVASNGKGPSKRVLHDFYQESNSTVSTEFMKIYSDTSLLVGKLGQARYWSKSQAKLLAAKILWSKLPILYEDMMA